MNADLDCTSIEMILSLVPKPKPPQQRHYTDVDTPNDIDSGEAIGGSSATTTAVVATTAKPLTAAPEVAPPRRGHRQK
jgi:hypothetical protein